MFILEGKVAIGYRLYSETFYGKMLEKKSVINDYACIYNKCSEFLYVAIEKVEGYAFRKVHYNEIIESE